MHLIADKTVIRSLLKQKARPVLILTIFILSAIAYTYKLINYTPWIGADTQPIYPRTSGDLTLLLVSPWSFHFGRTIIGIGFPYFAYLKEALYLIFGMYSEYILAVLWLVVASYGFYLLANLLKVPEYAKIVGALFYMFSSFTYSQRVHSIYGMMGAYALTPYIYIIITRILEKLVGEDSSHLKQASISILTGMFIGIIAISTLFPYYGIFILFLWFPLFISWITISAVQKYKARIAINGIIVLIFILIGFLSIYLINFFMLQITQRELLSIKNVESLLKVKAADFSYNYRFNNLPLPLWLAYPLATVIKIIGISSIISFILLIITLITSALALIIYIREISVTLKRKHYDNIQIYKFVHLSILLGIVIMLLYLIFAQYIAKNSSLLKSIWEHKIISIILSSITQPIKVGIAASLFEALILTKVMGLSSKRKIYYLIKAFIIITLMITIMTYSYNLPIGKGNHVFQEYVNSLSLLVKNQETLGFSHAGTPAVYIDNGKGYFRYYYTYGVALRPFTPYGSYVRHLEIEKNIPRYLGADPLVAKVLAKSLYISVYIDGQRNVHIYNYTIAPIYIVMPITIDPPKEEYYLDALMVMAELIARNSTLADKYLNSYLVFDVIPTNITSNAIHVIFTENTTKTDNSSIIVLIGKKGAINKIIYNRSIINNLQEYIENYSNINISFNINYLPFVIESTIKFKQDILKKLGTNNLIIRLNEYYSPYWQSNKLSKVSNTIFNIFIYKIKEDKNYVKISITHTMQNVKLFNILFALSLIIVGAYVTIRCNYQSHRYNDYSDI